MCKRSFHDCIHFSIPGPIRFEHLCNRDKTSTVPLHGEYGLEITVNFHFYRLEKAIKLAKK